MTHVVPWLAMSRWPTVPIKRVARLGTGHTPSRQQPEYWTDCTVPWITLADVWQLRDGTQQVITSTAELVSSIGLANSAAVLHPRGSVILSRTASVGFSAIMGQPMATSQDFAVWTCGSDIVPKFLLYVLRAMAPDLRRLSTGSTHKTIYMPDIEGLRTPLPPVEEQQRIVNFLDAETGRIDRLIELRRQALPLAVERTKAELDALFASPSWTPRRLKHLLARGICYGVLVPRFVEAGGVRFIRVNDLGHLEERAESLIQIDSALSREFSRTIVRHGDLLVAVVGSVGQSAVVPERAEGCNLARAVARLQPLEAVDARVLWGWTQTSDYMRQVHLATGSDTAQPTLNVGDLKNFTLRVPGAQAEWASARREVESVVDRHRAMRQLTEQHLELLLERRQALITAGVTGELDVSTARGAA